jgi:hypothetical protein
MSSDQVIEDFAETESEDAESYEELTDAASAVIPDTPALRLSRIAGAHVLVWLAAMGLFAAADSWSTVTGLSLAGFLCLIAGAILGVTTTTLVHEWFHYLGARTGGATYKIPRNVGLFVYDWDFERNSLDQFVRMSIAGSVGGAVAIVLLWLSVPADSWGRAAVHGGALAGFAFAAVIEWPVLRRTKVSGEPLAELSKIDKDVLSRAFTIAVLVGVTWAWLVQ